MLTSSQLLRTSLRSSTSLRFSPLLLAAVLLTGAAAPAQTLARPGWAGSGMMAETWWRNASFYRIDVRAYQDSNGDSQGDLRGIADRMDYLQNLGVDAIVLDNIGDPNETDAGFAEVVRAALPRHIHVLVTLLDAPNDSDDEVAAQARLWLTRGAAGIYLTSTRPADEAAPLLHLLRKLTDSYPGNRILLSEFVTEPEATPAATTSATAVTPPVAPTLPPAPTTTTTGRIHPIDLDNPAPQQVPAPKPARVVPSHNTTDAPHATSYLSGPQLTSQPLELANATAKTIRIALNDFNNSSTTTPLFLSEEMFSTKEILAPANLAALDGRRHAFALILFGSRGAASMRYGQEVGMLPVSTNATDAPIMQWTPTNVTAPPKPEPEVKPQPAPTPIPTRSDVYGTFKPYVATPKPIVLPKPPNEEPASAMTSTAGPVAPPADPDALPGFTSGTLPQPLPADAAKLNVATEDTDPNSLLNLYRRLIELHHDNPTMRNGQEILLDYDDLGAVVWIRQPIFGSRSTGIIAVCNLSGAPLHLSLDQELKQHRIQTGTLRNLLSNTATPLSVQSTNNLTLPAYGVFLGELYH